MKRKRINIITLGCPKNIVDSEKLLFQLKTGGYEVMHNADLNYARTVIINTCGFIHDAIEESINTILGYVKAKESGHIDKIYVIGCLSQRYKSALISEIPEVDKFFGVNEIPDVLRMFNTNFRETLSTSRILTPPGHYAYLKVSEGCDRKCAFCSIPFIRGNYISRSVEELVRESVYLANSGVKELILVAQDLSYYGVDLYKKRKLPDLIEELLKINSLEWIRLHYLYPSGLLKDLIPLMKENPKICRYIDLPIQHISDKMLKIMKRSHTRKETESILYKLRNEIPGVAIRTTVITGHPGETEGDYLELKRFTEEFRFERLGVFKYSHEEGTYAYNNFSDNIPDDIKEQRASEIMEIQRSISAEINAKAVDKVYRVIIDRREGDFFIGRTEFDSPEIDQEVLIPGIYNLSTGTIADITITESDDFELYGRPKESYFKP
ncbi:MAG TPA: 30S ribosomal protein S12 methylthiotransferase RimO [Bacteroidales bacterium]|nr:30S ribosomal protein S12 methylthiotransferase RimO [Bacteroidales bacterium]